MDGILLDTLIQAGALGVVAYIVLQWKREDEQEARQQLESLINQVTESHPKNPKRQCHSHIIWQILHFRYLRDSTNKPPFIGDDYTINFHLTEQHPGRPPQDGLSAVGLAKLGEM